MLLEVFCFYDEINIPFPLLAFTSSKKEKNMNFMKHRQKLVELVLI